MRFATVPAALILLLAAPLGAPAFADDEVRLSVVLDSTELLASINASPAPAIDTAVTFEVFDASYKIRATAAGFLKHGRHGPGRHRADLVRAGDGELTAAPRQPKLR